MGSRLRASLCALLIRFIYYIYNYRLLYYLPMERMKDLTQQYVEQLENMVKDLREKKLELEEENKKLEEKVETLELWLDNKEKLNEEYRKEIDLLKCQSLWPNELSDSLYDADKTIKKLEWRIANLKEEVEDSHKIIDKLREELSAYDREYFDEDKKASEIYKKQYQHSLGWDDELIYEEWLYD